MKDKVAKDWRTYETSAGGSVAGCCSCPVQAADEEEDHAHKCLACVNDDATTKPVSGEGPEHDRKQVAARQLAVHICTAKRWRLWLTRE